MQRSALLALLFLASSATAGTITTRPTRYPKDPPPPPPASVSDLQRAEKVSAELNRRLQPPRKRSGWAYGSTR